MKKQILAIEKIILSLLIVIVSSCSELTDLNKNVKNPLSASAEGLFTGAQKTLVDQIVDTNINRNIFRLIMQYWTSTTYTDQANYDLVSRSIPRLHWELLYRDALKNFDEAYKTVEATDFTVPGAGGDVLKNNQLAIIDIMMVYTYSVLVDTFGDVPYSEALDIGNFSPKYDDGLTIYKDLIRRLNENIEQMNPAAGSFSARADNMYQGNVSLWIKFANSLKLRLGLTLSDVPSEAALARATVEAAAPNVFVGNEDNADLEYLSSPPNTHPVYAALVLSGRQDYVAGKTLVDKMLELSDPRIGGYFTKVGDDYKGGTIGLQNTYSAFSHAGTSVVEATAKGVMFTYSEVEFLLAEAVERGYAVGGTAAEHYDKAIVASIQYWTGENTPTASYLARNDVAYATANGDWKEKIGVQSWIALYNRGYESWTMWRRLDPPGILVTPADPISVTPVRFTYPVDEQTLNKASLDAASSKIGGDLVATKLFWDVN